MELYDGLKNTTTTKKDTILDTEITKKNYL